MYMCMLSLVEICLRILCHISFHSFSWMFRTFLCLLSLCQSGIGNNAPSQSLTLSVYYLLWFWRCVDGLSYDQSKTWNLFFSVAKMIYVALRSAGSWCWKSSTMAQSRAEDDRGRNKTSKSLLAGVIFTIQVRKIKLITVVVVLIGTSRTLLRARLISSLLKRLFIF